MDRRRPHGRWGARITVIVVLAACAAALLLAPVFRDAAAGPAGEHPPFPERPPALAVLQKVPRSALAGGDVVLITLDTTRRDHLGCYGFASARTPVIDELAARSVVFEHAVTGVPSTLPSHASMLTGLEVPHHGVRTNGKYVLGEEHVTLAEILAQHGYASAAFVGTAVLDRRFGLQQGFDHYDDHIEKKRPAAEITDAAIAWLRDRRAAGPQQPVFMWVHYFDPHKPYDPPAEFAKMLPESLYDGEIAYVDHDMRRLLDALDEFGVLDGGLVILTADHGEGLGEHLEPTHSRLVYDTTMRIPLLITLPERFAAVGRVDDVTVGTIDLLPTILGLLGFDAPEAVDGLDLRAATVDPARLMYLETLAPLAYHGWSSLHALRGIDRKFILAPLPEYYDLQADPDELHSLVDGDPAVTGDLAVELERRMMAWPTPDDAFRAAAQLDRDTARRLAALGYVSSVEDGSMPPERLDPKDAMPLFDSLRSKNTARMDAAARELLVAPPVDWGAYRRALILAEEAVRLQPAVPPLKLTLGMALYRNNRFEDALRVLAEVTEPYDVAAQVFIAMALHHQGRDAYARQLISEIGEDIPQEHRAFLDEARSLVGEN